MLTHTDEHTNTCASSITFLNTQSKSVLNQYCALQQVRAKNLVINPWKSRDRLKIINIYLENPENNSV